jgi:tRNA modification GTPase
MHPPLDTIAARATPPGAGGIAVIRVSGPKALAVADRVFLGRHRPSRRPSHTLSHGRIADPRTGAMIDEVLLSIFRAPRSYTGEDVVEISCHGGLAASDAILRLLAGQGVRPAERGEFTRRAVLNGKLDLAQAEAIPELVQARSDQARARAVSQLTGVFSDRLERLRIRLQALQMQLVAALESGEDSPSGVERQIARNLRSAGRQLARLQQQAEAGPLLRQGALVVIIGKPNVGKSSLFNRLVGEERAIVTEIPGTTRDCLEASLEIDGMVLRLVDTAGWRTSTGKIEAIGKARAMRYAERADLLLVTIDGSVPLTREDEAVLAAAAGQRRIVVLNKSDLADGHRQNPRPNVRPRVRVSARNGTGIRRLSRLIVRAFSAACTDADFIANQRHREGLRRARTALESAQATPALDLQALEVGNAAGALDELLGRVTTEELLDRVFREFCIGK